jgi:hypothetical protein
VVAPLTGTAPMASPSKVAPSDSTSSASVTPRLLAPRPSLKEDERWAAFSLH